MREITEIIIHCTATPEGRDYSVDEIRRWHTQRGFADVGYHFIIHLDGSIEPGRPLTQPGAHCTGHNAQSIGVAYVGGLSRGNLKPMDTRTDAQKTALRNLVRDLRTQFPRATVHGHREFARKECPCFDVRKEFSNH